MSSTINALTSGGGVAITGDTSGQLQLQTNNGTTAVTVDTSQNVGIGTTSPAQKLDVQTSGGRFQVVPLGGSSVSLYNGTSGGNIALDSSGGITLFKQNGTESMRIDTNGCLAIGATAVMAGEKLFVSGSVTDNISRMFNSSATPFGLYIRYSGAAPNNTGQEFLFCNDTTATRFTARSNGGIANYSGNNVNLSDLREKTNVELAGNYLDKICAIPVKTFNYIDQNREEDDGLTLGVVAQDVQAIAPELVAESNWGTKELPKMRLSIYQTDLQYALMKAIQELNAKVDAQAAEIQALKGVA